MLKPLCEGLLGNKLLTSLKTPTIRSLINYQYLCNREIEQFNHAVTQILPIMGQSDIMSLLLCGLKYGTISSIFPPKDISTKANYEKTITQI